MKIGHLNVNHLKNKMTDISVLVSHPTPFHIFGISETWLNALIGDEAVTVPNYLVHRRDPLTAGQTGLAAYIHSSVQQLVYRRFDLETPEVECLWLEVKYPKSKSLLIGFLYRHPSSTFEWYDFFCNNMDRALKKDADILLMGDFNIDMLKPQLAWDSTFSLFGLTQLVANPTRITPTSETLLDHIYTNRPSAISDICIPGSGISDHSPTLCTWFGKSPKEKKHSHTTIKFRSFKRFNKHAFWSDLSKAGFQEVMLSNDPNVALTTWYKTFLSVLNKHAPIREKRVKSKQLPPWLTPEIMSAMKIRDSLKCRKHCDEFKKTAQ